FGLILRDKTKDDSVSKNEGLMYALLNSAWLIGPLVAGYFAKNYGFGSVFFLSSVFIFISLFFFKTFRIKDGRRTREIDHHRLRIVTDFFRHKGRVFTYLLNTAVNFWWAFIYIYMPIYIVDNGHSEVVVGIFLAAVTLPLVFLDYLFGRVAGKSGFKKLFFIGFISLGVLAVICFFISDLYVILGLLVLASFSLSMIEPTADAYFFDIVEKEERDKYYGIYTTSINTGNLLGSLPAAALLLFLPFNSLFIFYGLPMIVLAFLALGIEDSFPGHPAKEYKKDPEIKK
ncbi:MAG: MFS transporter, partial [Candidatus Pacearchaeota archaeon]|nr:MFS transporter [Candidatus Pacearchaeota archaeon]